MGRSRRRVETTHAWLRTQADNPGGCSRSVDALVSPEQVAAQVLRRTHHAAPRDAAVGAGRPAVVVVVSVVVVVLVVVDVVRSKGTVDVDVDVVLVGSVRSW
jgi:hypothetical protein